MRSSEDQSNPVDGWTRIGITALRRHLSEVIRRVESGERFVITRRSVPTASLVPLAADDAPNLAALPAEWRKTFWGGPIPDFVHAIRRSREEH